MGMKLLQQLSDVDLIWPARAPHYLTTSIVSVNINPLFSLLVAFLSPQMSVGAHISHFVTQCNPNCFYLLSPHVFSLAMTNDYKIPSENDI